MTLIVLPTPSPHIEIVHTIRCTPIREHVKLHINVLVLKYATKLINLLLEERRVKVVRETALTKKVVPTSKEFEKRWSRAISYGSGYQNFRTVALGSGLFI